MARLVFLGTSHISPESIQAVKDHLLKDSFDIVCLELDRQRFVSLFKEKSTRPKLSDIKHVGVKGLLFMMLGAWAEKKLGSVVGTKPGDEMRAAAVIAKEQQIKIALIDQPLQITLKRFSKAMTWKEKFRFVWEIVKSPFGKSIPFDLKKVPEKEIMERLMKEVKQKFPSVYRVLVTERNEYMAKKLEKVREVHPEANLLVVMGAGHVEEVKKLTFK